MAGNRKKITPATEAALWTLSSGRCYAPGCPSPVVVEVRPGVYRKNAQVAHIYGVGRYGPRSDRTLSEEDRDSFSNLLLLCLAHHGEVDDKKTGAKLYPPDLLRKWKTDHEGSSGPVLAGLGSIDEESLTELLLDVFAPPVERLQQIADQLEETGTLNADTVAQLRQVVDVMNSTPAGPDARTAALLADTADMYGSLKLDQTAAVLVEVADVLPRYNQVLDRKIARLEELADLLSASG